MISAGFSMRPAVERIGGLKPTYRLAVAPLAARHRAGEDCMASIDINDDRAEALVVDLLKGLLLVKAAATSKKDRLEYLLMLGERADIKPDAVALEAMWNSRRT
jgi:hypothetical protein